MYKYFLLISTKLKKIILVILFIIPLAVGGYFVYDGFFKESITTDKPLHVTYTFNKTHDNADLLNNDYVFKSQVINDNNNNTVTIRCSFIKTELGYKTINYGCSVFMIDYYGQEVAILKIEFENISEYFGACFLSIPQGSNYNDSLICNLSNYNEKVEKYYEEVVLTNSLNFVKSIYDNLKYGSELAIIKKVIIGRGDANNIDASWGILSNSIIKLYISNKSETDLINQDYYDAVANQAGDITHTFKRNHKSLQQTFFNIYGQHLATFNKYKGRNFRFDFTNDANNPLYYAFNDFILRLRNGFNKTVDGLSTQEEQDFVKLIQLANQRQITETERDEAINIFQKSIYKDSNQYTNLLLKDLINDDIKNKFFANCNANQEYSYLGLTDIKKINTETDPKGDKQKLYLKLQKWFNWENIISQLYTILISKTPIFSLSNCPNLANEEYNYLNYLISFSIFKFHPFLNLGTTTKLANMIFYNVPNLANNLTIEKNNNEGIIIAKKYDTNFIDNNITISPINSIETQTFLIDNEDTTIVKDKIFYKMGYVLTKERLNSQAKENRYSVYLGYKNVGIFIFPYDWNNIAYKHQFLITNDSQMSSPNDDLKGFVTSFYIDEGSIRRIAETNIKNFLFHDEKNPGIYAQDEAQMILVTLPIINGI